MSNLIVTETPYAIVEDVSLSSVIVETYNNVLQYVSSDINNVVSRLFAPADLGLDKKLAIIHNRDNKNVIVQCEVDGAVIIPNDILINSNSVVVDLSYCLPFNYCNVVLRF